MKRVQTVVRTYRVGSPTTDILKNNLKYGYHVVMATPIIGTKGETECIEYILEKEVK